MHVHDANRHHSWWYEDDGEFRLLGGSTLAPECEPHFHETYSIAFISGGSAMLHARGLDLVILPGMAVLLNPFEIASCTSADDAFTYDICYPPVALMEEVARQTGVAPAGSPSFGPLILTGPTADHIRGLFRAFDRAVRPDEHLLETAVIRFLVAHPGLFQPAADERPHLGCSKRARELIHALIDQPITVNEISRRLRTSRSYFARSFASDFGISPSWYIRQKRLLRGLGFLRDGQRIASAAIDAGFSDQAHFTREFKRFYGTTPGKLVRDIARPREGAPPKSVCGQAEVGAADR